MKTPRLLLACALSSICLSLSLFAQGGPGMGGPVPGVDPLFLKLFSLHQGFSAQTSITVFETGRNDTTTIESSYEFSNGKLRVDLDLGKMKSPDMPAEAASQLEAMGMGQMTTLTRPELGLTYVVYPGLKAYAEMPVVGGKTTGKPEDTTKFDSTDLGKEDVDGIACAKKKMVFSMEDGKKREMTAWLATGMKDFPLKIQVEENQAIVTILFKNVKLEAPAASRFDAPTGYTAYKNIQQMMQTEMMKKLGGGMPGM